MTGVNILFSHFFTSSISYMEGEGEGGGGGEPHERNINDRLSFFRYCASNLGGVQCLHVRIIEQPNRIFSIHFIFSMCRSFRWTPQHEYTLVHFNLQREKSLSVKDKNGWSQRVHYSEFE